MLPRRCADAAQSRTFFLLKHVTCSWFAISQTSMTMPKIGPAVHARVRAVVRLAAEREEAVVELEADEPRRDDCEGDEARRWRAALAIRTPGADRG